MDLDPDEIIASIETAIDGAKRVLVGLKGNIQATAERHARLHELSPADAKRILRADQRLAAVLAVLGRDATVAAKRVREAIDRRSHESP